MENNGNVFELPLVSENQHPGILPGEYDDEEPVSRSRCVLGYFISLMLIEFFAFYYYCLRSRCGRLIPEQQAELCGALVLCSVGLGESLLAPPFALILSFLPC